MKMACSFMVGTPVECRLGSLYSEMRKAAREGARRAHFFSGQGSGSGIEAREQPGARVRPEAIRATRRDAERLGRLVECEAGEIAEFHEFRRPGVAFRQRVEGVVNGQQLVRRPLQWNVGV